MQAIRARSVRLVAASMLLAAPAFAVELDPSQFDLLCQGTMQSTLEKSAASPFTSRIQIDLQLKAFCIDNFCDLFTRAEPLHLDYHCDVASRTTFCGEVGGSTAGPFPQRQDFSFDRSSGSFQRTVSGEEGDLATFPFNESDSGNCTLAPFTKFSKFQQTYLFHIVHKASQ